MSPGSGVSPSSGVSPRRRVARLGEMRLHLFRSIARRQTRMTAAVSEGARGVMARRRERQNAFVPHGAGVTPQGHQGKIQAVHVILEIENFRKTGAGKVILAPVAVGLLRGDQVIDAR